MEVLNSGTWSLYTAAFLEMNPLMAEVISTVISVTESRSQKYNLAPFSFPLNALLCPNILFNFNLLDHGKAGKTCTLSKMLIDHFFFFSLQEHKVWFLTNVTVQGPHSEQLLAKLLQIACTAPTLHECWKWTMSTEARAKAHFLKLWPRSERSSLPSAFSQASCWLTVFHNPLWKPEEVGTDFFSRKEQSKY